MMAMRAGFGSGRGDKTECTVVTPTSPCTYSEEPGVLRIGVVLATFLVLACASCSDDNAAPVPTPSTHSASSTPSAPTPSVPAELAGFTEDERAAYLVAVDAYADYLHETDRIYAEGKTTAAAKDFYRRYAIDWSTTWGNLAVAVNNGVTITGQTRLVWTRPKSINIGTPAGDIVVIRRCLDESHRVVKQNGAVVEQPQSKDPHVYTVRLEKRAAEDWWRAGIAKLGKTC